MQEAKKTFGRQREAIAGRSPEGEGRVFFSAFDDDLSTLSRIPKTMGPLRGNRGRSRADPRRILALSCLSALHNIETTLRSVVPPAAGLHTYTWCTTSARNPLSPSLFSLSLFLSLSPPSSFISFPSPSLLSQPFPPSLARPFGLRSTPGSVHSAPCLFLLLPLFLLSSEEKGAGG